MYIKRGRLGTFILLVLVFYILFITPNVNAKLNSLNITISEEISEIVAFDGISERNTGLSRTNIALHPLFFNGTIVIENVGDDILSNINISLNETDLLTTNLSIFHSPSYSNIQLSEIIPGTDAWIYIGQLLVGDNVTLSYDADATSFGEPINVTESYSEDRIMLGSSLNISVNVSNSLTQPVTLNNIVITKYPQEYIDEDGNPTWFNYTNLAGPDSSNATITYTGGKPTLVWNVSNKTLAQGEWNNIWFDATSPYSLNESELGPGGMETYLVIGNMTISFDFSGLSTGLNVIDVLGNSMAAVTAQKELINTTHWRASVNFSNVADSIDYNLTKISVWATNFTSGGFVPDDPAYLVPESNFTWYPNLAVANKSYWASSDIEFAWDWVPVIWVDVALKILDDGTQIRTLYEGKDKQGGYLFVQEIYVLKGYFIKATKRIIPYGLSNPNIYNVSIVLENIGTSRTPEWLSAFDLIPPGFNLVNLDTGLTNNNRNVSDGENDLLISNSLGTYDYGSLSDLVLGVSDTGIINVLTSNYYNYSGFHVDLRAIYPNSNGDTLYDSANSTQEIEIFYQMNGTGDISRIQNAYIIGVDPVRIQGATGTKELDANVFIELRQEKSKIIASTLVLLVSLIGTFIITFNKK